MPTHSPPASAPAANHASIPLSPSPSTSPDDTISPATSPDQTPPWANPTPHPSAARRLSSRRAAAVAAAADLEAPLHKQLLSAGQSIVRRATSLYISLSPLSRTLVLVGGTLLLLLTILFLVFSHRIFAALGPIAQGWRALPFGWALIWLLTFATAFPPLIGYSSAVTTAGFVYGFPLGWPIVMTATVAGATASFATSRGVFSGYVHRLVGRDKRFVALGQVLRRDGLGMLTLVRVCPLPYSLSNGFLATVPNVRVASFAAATALASPKLLVHVFIGSRLAQLVEEGDKMSTADRVVNYVSMAAGGLLGLGVGYVMYKRTMRRAAELAREEAEEMGVDPSTLMGDDDDETDGMDGDDDDEESRLMRAVGGDPDAAALMDDDDISLWEREGDGVEGGYSDGWEEDAKAVVEHRNGNGNGTGIGKGNGFSK